MAAATAVVYKVVAAAKLIHGTAQSGRSQPVPPIWRITRRPCARRALPGRMITLNTSWKTSCSWLDRLAADARQGEPGLLRLDEDEWVTLADSDDLGALADQGGHELQGMPGQRAARA